MTLAVQDNFQTALAEIESINRLVESLMKVPHYAKMGIDGVNLVVAKARSLNIDPLYALNGALYNVKGKIGMAAETMAAMIREKGHSIVKDKASNDTVCILHGRRADNGDTWTVSFSIQDAQRAGIYGDTWKKYPGIMVYNRAMSMLARQLFPDIIKGCGYTMDELKEISKNTNDKISHLPASEYEELKQEVLCISKDQSDNLDNILKTCSPEYKAKLEKWLNDSIGGLSKLPLDMHEKLLGRMKKDAAEYAELQLKYANEPQSASEEVANVA